MAKKIDIPGGSVRGSGDGSGGGAMTTSEGKGTADSPNVRTTTSVDSKGDVKESHNTVRVDGKEKKL